MLLDENLQRDLSGACSESFNVAVVELDRYRLILSARGGSIGSDTLIPAIHSWEGGVEEDRASFTVELGILPADLGFWVRRSVRIYQVVPSLSTIEDGLLIFSGIIEEEGSVEDDLLTVVCAPFRIKPVLIPANNPITLTNWPNASESAVGKVPPEVYGLFEDLPILPVSIPVFSTLSADVSPVSETQFSSNVSISISTPGIVTWTNHGLVTGQTVKFSTSGSLPTGLLPSIYYYVIFLTNNTFKVAKSLADALSGISISTTGTQSGSHRCTMLTTGSLPVSDASKFPNSGVVVVDDSRYTYASRTDSELFGVILTAYHKSGTTVSVLGNSVFQAAGHEIQDISSVRSDSLGAVVSGWTPDLTNGLIRFPGVPTVESVVDTQELQAQFDQVDPSSTALNGFNAIRAVAVPLSGESNPQTQSASSGGSYSVSINIPVSYEIGTEASGDGSPIYKPLSLNYQLPAGVIAGTYTFLVQFLDQTQENTSHVSTVTVGGVSQTLNYTKPTYLEFKVPLASNQAVLLITHSQIGAPWPLDMVNPTSDVIIFNVTGTILTSNGMPSAVTGSGEVVFNRPAKVSGVNQIIAGAYRVAYSVTINPDVPLSGQCNLSIGGQVVWAWDAGTVVYEQNPVTVEQDSNTDKLPLSWTYNGVPETAGLQGLPSFKVDVTSAVRTVLIGNTDNSVYAILRKSTNTTLAVNQTTDMASRGRIKSAQLMVEFWSKAQEINAVDVYWDGSKLGQLSFATDAGTGSQTISKTISVDTVANPGAALRSSNVSGIVSNPANYSSNISTSTLSIPAAYTQSGATSGSWFGSNKPLTQILPLPPGTIAQSITFYVSFGAQGSPYSLGNSQVLIGGNYVSPDFNVIRAVTVYVSAGSTGVTMTHQHIFGTSFGLPASEPMIQYVYYNVQVNPQFALSGGGFSGTPSVSSNTVDVNNFSPVARVDNSAGSNNLKFTIPGSATPRSAINVFDLPMASILGWRYFLNKQAKLIYTGTDTINDLNVCLVALLIQYERIANVPAVDLVANVSGHSGNPADVIKDLVERSGHPIDLSAYTRLRNYYAQTGWQLSRAIDTPTEASQLLSEAALQSLITISPQDDGYVPVRVLDTLGDVRELNDYELMSKAKITWEPSQNVLNSLTYNYRHRKGFNGASDSTRTIERNSSTPDYWARRGEEELGERQATTVDSLWVGDDTTALMYAQDWLHINAPMRRKISVQLPYTFVDLQIGDLVRLVSLDILCRVSSCSKDDMGFIDATLSELPT